ncbi:hypothetical protein SISSUDRAFT_1067861 [Sistotremastrum suecicum HHB10207 ss-3]|uniref:Uncharacterized protein n=1 Tax=Sistotremastrum suecicum HHB10207 ss-3 TaxID=1314776 RepID=A0A165WM15_9AGAM|nr:hypothetical protein SISSUDRAFT_1067861 [Sistotremastrum suecicum HHB10207 ss-3]
MVEIAYIAICPVADGDDSMTPPSLTPASLDRLIQDGLAVDRDGDGPLYVDKNWSEAQLFGYAFELMPHVRRFAKGTGVEAGEFFVGALKKSTRISILPKNPPFTGARWHELTKGQRHRGSRPPLVLAVRKSFSKRRLGVWSNGGFKKPISDKGKGKADDGDTSDDLASEEPLSTVVEKRLKRKAQDVESDDDRPLQPPKKKTRSPTPFPSPAPSPEPEAAPAAPVIAPAPVVAPVVTVPAPVVAVTAPVPAPAPAVANPPAAVIVIPDSPPAHRLRRRPVRPFFQQASTSFNPFA